MEEGGRLRPAARHFCGAPSPSSSPSDSAAEPPLLHGVTQALDLILTLASRELCLLRDGLMSDDAEAGLEEGPGGEELTRPLEGNPSLQQRRHDGGTTAAANSRAAVSRDAPQIAVGKQYHRATVALGNLLHKHLAAMQPFRTCEKDTYSASSIVDNLLAARRAERALDLSLADS